MSQICVSVDVTWRSYGGSAVIVGRRNLNNLRARKIVSATTVAVTPTNQDDDFRRPASPAAFLAIGTANPANCVAQDEYTDYYFRITKSDHLTELKHKMKRICAKSGVKKRYFHNTEKIMGDNPDFVDRTRPSLDARMAITAVAIPELGAAAAAKAIHEWGRPASDITHLVVSTYSASQMPGPDLGIASLLGLHPSVQRTMLHYHGCFAGSSALRVAKDMAENNHGARILVVCVDLTGCFIQSPHQDHLDTLVVQALFGDGAAAVIVGADPHKLVERPIFEVLSASQTLIPGSEHVVNAKVSECGFDYRLSSQLPAIIGANIEKCLVDALMPTGLLSLGCGWNGLFWAVHPGGRAILDSCGAALQLEPGKLAASRRVLAEYGNMSGATVIFVLDELRRRHMDDDQGDLGVMVGFGPGVTVEVMALRRALHANKEI